MNKIYFLLSFALALGTVAGCQKKEAVSSASTTSTTSTASMLQISGTIQLAPDLASKVQETDTVFLIARPAEGGPPLAVKKWLGKSYPYAFELTDKDLMIPDRILDTPLNLIVRVDKDGDAMTKNPGDLMGTYEKNPVSLKAENVEILVNEVLQ